MATDDLIAQVRILHSDERLHTTRTVVLDCGGEMYVWSGLHAGGYLRWAARTLAEKLRTSGERKHDKVPALREFEGCESASFRSKFATWHWLREANPSGMRLAAFAGAGGTPLLPAGQRAPRVLTIEEEVTRMRRQRDAILTRWRLREEAEAAPADASGAADAAGMAPPTMVPPTPLAGSMGPAEAWQSPFHSRSPEGAPLPAMTPGGLDTGGEGSSPAVRARLASSMGDEWGEVVAAEGVDGAAGAEGAASGAVDPETEAVNVWLVGGDVFELLTIDEAGIFWSANAYMVLYSYAVDGRQRSSLWFWKGADVTPLNFLTWRFQLSQLLQSMPENPVPRTITQGEEPERFLAVMEGTIILSGSHPLTRPRPLAPEPSPATVAIVDAMQTSLSAGGAASGSGAAVAAAGEAEAPPPPAPVPIPVESLPSLKGVVLLQVKRYASTALGVCARQVRDDH